MSVPAIQIRAASAIDLIPISQLSRRVFGDEAHSIVVWRQLLDIAAPLVLIARVGEMDVGYSAVASTWDAGFAWFLTLGVVPELQNQGVGRRLVEESVERAAARGVRKINLTVNAGNGPTVRLYGNLGFGPEVEAADYFGPGEDRLVMSWRQSDSGKDVERRRGRRDCPSPDIGFS